MPSASFPVAFENFHIGEGKKPGCAHGKKIADKTLGTEKAGAFHVVSGHLHAQGTMRDLKNITGSEK